MSAYRILWPDRRTVSDEQIRVWYDDAIANGEAETEGLTETRDMAMDLHRAGLITLARGEG